MQSFSIVLFLPWAPTSLQHFNNFNWTNTLLIHVLFFYLSYSQNWFNFHSIQKYAVLKRRFYLSKWQFNQQNKVCLLKTKEILCKIVCLKYIFLKLGIGITKSYIKYMKMKTLKIDETIMNYVCKTLTLTKKNCQ